MGKLRIVTYLTESGRQISKKEFLKSQTKNLSNFVLRSTLIKNGSFAISELAKAEKNNALSITYRNRKYFNKKDILLILKQQRKQPALF